MKNSRINIAVLGLGYMGQNHARILASMPGVKLVAVCDLDRSKSRELGDKYKAKHYQDFLHLIDHELLNAIFICLPTTLHYKASKHALKKKIAVFIEKPISDSINQAKDLIQISVKNNIQIMIGHIERFNPVVQEIKKRIDSGELGKIFYIHTQRFSPPPARIQDVSVIVDLATHDVDIINYLLGEEPTRIYAESRKTFHKYEDLTSAILRFKSGLMGLVEVSWLHPTKIRSISITGENGMYQANYITQELFFYKQKEKILKRGSVPLPEQNWAEVIKIAFESKEPLQIELEAFINSLKTKSQMPVSAREGLNALVLTQKISKSGETHKILK